jgi:hypothetical protein
MKRGVMLTINSHNKIVGKICFCKVMIPLARRPTDKSVFYSSFIGYHSFSDIGDSKSILLKLGNSTIPEVYNANWTQLPTNSSSKRREQLILNFGTGPLGVIDPCQAKGLAPNSCMLS